MNLFDQASEHLLEVFVIFKYLRCDIVLSDKI